MMLRKGYELGFRRPRPMVGGLMVLFLLAVAPCAVRGDDQARVWPRITEMEQIRQTLIDQLAQRLQASEDGQRPRDVSIALDRGLGRGPLELHLRRHAGQWFVRELEGGRRAPEIDSVILDGLVWEGDRIMGTIELRWTLAEPEDGPPPVAEPDDDQEAARDQVSQVFTVDLTVIETRDRIALSLVGFHGHEPWVLVYEADGGNWRFTEEAHTPRSIDRHGGFERNPPRIEPDEAGRFEAKIDLTYVGGVQRYRESYQARQPEITINGRILDGRVEGRWQMRAPAGKALLGTHADRLEGALQGGRVQGRYHSGGEAGEWMGTASGAIRLVGADELPRFEEADDEDEVPRMTAEQAALRAAQLYRQILALEVASRQYPMPWPYAMSRTLVPEPVRMPDVAGYIDQLLVQARLALEPELEAVPSGMFTVEDPTFGPYLGTALERLDIDEQGINQLPPASEGPQRWASPVGWRVIGPFSVHDPTAPVLRPEIVPFDEARYGRERLRTETDGRIIPLTDPAVWLDADDEAGLIAVPDDARAHAHQLRHLAWYAVNQIHSASSRTVWASMRVQGRVDVWINGRRAWTSGLGLDSPHPAIMPLRLDEGVNQVLVRVANDTVSNGHFSRMDWFDGFARRPQGRIPFTHFALHFAIQGEPEDRQWPSMAAGIEPSGTRGYRHDGTNRFDDVTPPLAWDIQRGINVAWKVDLPEGYGSPVVHGDRLYLTAEPDRLLCIDGQTGRTLWERTLRPEGAPEAVTEGRRRGPQTSITPVVDDQAVYVHVGNGVAASFSHDGEPRWLVETGGAWRLVNMGSPMRIDDRLIIQTHLPDDEDGRFALMALHAETGETVWTARGPARRVYTSHDRGQGLGHGVAAMRLVNGTSSRTVLITGDGAVVNAVDGRLLQRSIFGLEANRAAPVVVDDVAYITPVSGQEAVRLWLDEDGRVGARTVWRTGPRWGRGQARTVANWGERHWMTAPVIRDGLIYVVRIDSAHVPQHYVCPWTQLEVFDQHTGRRLARYRAIIRDATDPTIPPVIAGDYLFVGDGGAPVGGFGGNTEHGVLAVLELPDRAQLDRMPSVHTPTNQGLWGMAHRLSRNNIERTRSAPVFANGMMYLRGESSLVAIAVTTSEGRRFERETVARSLVLDVVGDRPAMPTIKAPAVADEPPDHADAPVGPLQVDQGAEHWMLLGPIDPAHASEAHRLLGGEDMLWPKVGDEVMVAGRAHRFVRIGSEHIEGAQQRVDVISAFGGQRTVRGYLYTVLESRQRQRVGFNQPSAVTAAWIAGVKVENGDVLDLELGYYPLLLEVSIDRLPDFAPNPKLTTGIARPPRIDDTTEFWLRRIELLKERLIEITTTMPGHQFGRAARLRLAQIGIEPPPAPGSTPGSSPGSSPGSATDSAGQLINPARTESPDSGADKPAESGLLWLILAGGSAAVIIAATLLVLRRLSSRTPDDGG
ncbi:MAG: PQQ-binding-like beta-propeller repeat protein [Phycisphaeraceae bacterium]|nr:PQQ-binding-like beta-propeller repeat protein [Phycisphaeraceae bacterium]